ncbi:MAG: UDP-glucose 4-epimerase GalE [Planctomycetes bacterium]|nr:UDP-glucose 4-epimerase GalE [Planctomycetota bacterium]
MAPAGSGSRAAVLVVGGAGYVGSHTVKGLLAAGYRAVVFDNLSTGHRQAVPRGARFLKGDLLQPASLGRALAAHRFQAVFHFAARALVGESVADPALYYRQNLTGTQNLLDAMRAHGVGKIVFSSTAAVYGEVRTAPLREDHPKAPCNPYGRTKWTIECMLRDYGAAYGLRSVSLRYFNAAGCDPDGELGEDHDPETHLIPNVLRAARDRRRGVRIFGDDYETPDGTCVRDYVHVTDLAQAHVRALEKLDSEIQVDAFNLGNGSGYSVREVVDMAREVTGRPIRAELVGRRPGDPPVLVASAERARAELGWQPVFGALGTILETAWGWHRTHPRGYGR